jgi:putative heme-binding domain-containing protein
LRESTPEIRARAGTFLGDEEYSNRKTIVEDWLKMLPVAGDPARGRAAFEKVCAQCHAVEGVGYAVGPDLAALAHRSVEDLASNILDPNMAIQPNYVSFIVENVSGEIESGILESESSEAITLLQALGRKVVISRAHIKRMESTGLSLMPEGLEAGLSPADLRDVISFIQRRP